MWYDLDEMNITLEITDDDIKKKIHLFKLTIDDDDFDCVYFRSTRELYKFAQENDFNVFDTEYYYFERHEFCSYDTQEIKMINCKVHVYSTNSLDY